jgi:DNA-directed RNA polymerase specialized sigma24 family protein
MDSLVADINECYGRVVRAVAGAVGRLDAAEDAVHEAVEAALRAPPRTIARADAWLYRVALRRARRSSWRRRLELPLRAVSSSTPGPSSDRVIALQLLDRLTDRQRSFVIARYYLDLSYEEIADTFGVSVGTTSATLSQALQRMRGVAEERKEAS